MMRPIVLDLTEKMIWAASPGILCCLPLYSYYKNNEGKIVTDIGDYAKSRYGTRAGFF